MTKRKYFGTDGIRGLFGESVIHPEFVLKLGWAAGKVLSSGRRKKVLIGKDTRISGYILESALESGLSAAGADARLLGPMPTPGIAYLTRTFRAQAGIVISASHNSFEDNGIKFFGADGYKLSDELEHAIEDCMDLPLKTVAPQDLGKVERIDDAPGRYIEFCKSTIPSSARLSGFKIVVDCAHGATYHVAPKVFQELGAEIVIVGAAPNGFNINDQCGSTHTTLLQETVLREQADLGIALDGDGDRVILVDHQGVVVDGDEALYIITKDRLEHQRIQGGIVGTVMSNLGLEHAVRGMGLDFARVPVGDRYVIAGLCERGWTLGGEASGHVVCLDNTTTGDGIITALQVLLAMFRSERKLADLKRGFTKFPQVTRNIKATNGHHIITIPSIIEAVRDAEVSLSGLGRVLLRPSGTEPLVRIMVEGEDSSKVAQVADTLALVVQQAVSSQR
jgi:phosphoglucosamine mutase